MAPRQVSSSQVIPLVRLGWTGMSGAGASHARAGGYRRVGNGAGSRGYARSVSRDHAHSQVSRATPNQQRPKLLAAAVAIHGRGASCGLHRDISPQMIEVGSLASSPIARRDCWTCPQSGQSVSRRG